MSNNPKSNTLTGRRIAILATKGFEEVELTEPKKALEAAGAKVDIVAPASGIKNGKIRSWAHTDWGAEYNVDVNLADANPSDYDALQLPGGVMNPDYLRLEPKAIAFVKSFVLEGKPIAAICHAPWTLINAGVAKGRTLTSWPSLETDLRNAGAEWVDQQVVVDKDLVTSRKPDDLPAFNIKMVEVFSKAAGKQQHAAA
ncbi:MAG TPA: type 1 glutamine amidotransferase domain-containing protein [Edaphobacter sp.]